MEVTTLPIENRVREHRERLGWSQEQLAKKSGVGQSTISEIEAGKHVPTVEVALMLTKALGTTIEDTFSLKK